MKKDPFSKSLKRFLVVVALAVAFGYVEAAVVVYLRAIFHPDGFSFPLTTFGVGPQGRQLILTEVGREIATIVIIFTGAYLSGGNRRQRIAHFMTIFAVWDIFYYIWLKVLLNWPAGIMDWDILFLIPMAWASPVLYPVLVSLTMLAFSGIIIYREHTARPLRAMPFDVVGFVVSALILITAFCLGGRHAADPDYAEYFSPSLFAAGILMAIAIFTKCVLKSPRVRTR